MPPNNLTIKDWSPADQPREKLRDYGSRFLSDAELLAIIIGSGTIETSAVELSKIILSSVKHNLNNLAKLSLYQLTLFKGIGEAKAIKISAAMELGLRQNRTESIVRATINSSQSVVELMAPVLGLLNFEEFWVLYLNNSNKLLHKSQISKGGLTATVVDTRLIFKEALELGAVALILVHNHPSGSLKPSPSDLNLTKKIQNAASTLEIKVLDHIILTEKSYFSFADENVL